MTLRVGQGSWYGVLRMFSQLTDKGIDLLSFCPTKVGDGGFTDWMGNEPHMDMFLTVFAMDLYQHTSVSD